MSKRLLLIFLLFMLLVTMLHLTSGTAQTVSSCQTLLLRTRAAFGATCTSTTPKYDPVADINKDKKVDIKDAVAVGFNYNNESWCQAKLAETYNPCTTPVDISLTCGKCSFCTPCECSQSGSSVCRVGFWVVKGEALAESIIEPNPQNMIPTPSQNIIFTPIRGGTVEVYLLCLYPYVIKKVEISVEGGGMLCCPKYCPIFGSQGPPCICSVSDCSDGTFIATGQPLAFSVIKDVAGFSLINLSQTKEGIISAILLCTQPPKVERSYIQVDKLAGPF